MSTPFLFGFAGMLVDRLVADGLLLVAPGARDRVVTYLGNPLGLRAQGGTLLSEVDEALLDCDGVEEVFYDVEQLKVVVEDLKA